MFLSQHKKPLKTKVSKLLRRTSTGTAAPEGKLINGYFTGESKVGSLGGGGVAVFARDKRKRATRCIRIS